MHRIVSTSLVIASLGLLAAAPVVAQQVDGSSEMRNDRVEYRADLSGSGTPMSGGARYREETRRGMIRSRLDIEVEDAEPKTTYKVTINGAFAGTITTNAFGTGEISFRFPSDDPGHNPNVPVIVPGDIVAVGPVSGAMK